jgi:hypothetical protein
MAFSPNVGGSFLWSVNRLQGTMLGAVYGVPESSNHVFSSDNYTLLRLSCLVSSVERYCGN